MFSEPLHHGSSLQCFLDPLCQYFSVEQPFFQNNLGYAEEVKDDY